MNYTSNMGMNMPDENDKFSIEHFNTNTQALDIVGKPDEYKNTKTYAVGDLCIHNNILYKCIIAVETAEEFNAEKWEVTSLCKEEIANKTAIAELNENNAIETLSYTSNVSNYFMQFYKQGNHVWGNAFTKTTVFSDKTTIKFSADNFNGKKDGDLRIFCKFPGNIFSLNENVQHIIGIGSFRFENASTLYVYPIQVVAVYNGTDTEIRVPFTSVSNPADVRYEFIVDTIL